MLFWSFSNVHLCTDKQCKFPGIFSPLKQGSAFQGRGKGCLWIQCHSQLRESESYVVQTTPALWVMDILAPPLQMVPKIKMLLTDVLPAIMNSEYWIMNYSKKKK